MYATVAENLWVSCSEAGCPFGQLAQWISYRTSEATFKYVMLILWCNNVNIKVTLTFV